MAHKRMKYTQRSGALQEAMLSPKARANVAVPQVQQQMNIGSLASDLDMAAPGKAVMRGGGAAQVQRGGLVHNAWTTTVREGARALVTDPALLLLDEPLAALDARQRREVRTFLAERLGNLGCPTVLVTHDLRDLTELDATVVVLEDGRVVQQGTPDELAAAPATAFVSELAR